MIDLDQPTKQNWRPYIIATFTGLSSSLWVEANQSE
jgi:hypothetical protein